MLAEGINKVTRNVLFVLVTDAAEQNSYSNNSAQMLVQTKEISSSPRLNELVPFSDAIAKGRFCSSSVMASQCQIICQFPLMTSQAAQTLSWTYAKGGSYFIHRLLMCYSSALNVLLLHNSAERGLCFAFHLSFQIITLVSAATSSQRFVILPLSFVFLLYKMKWRKVIFWDESQSQQLHCFFKSNSI